MEARAGKASVREQVSAAKRRLGTLQRGDLSRAIAGHLWGLPAYQQARCVGLYAGLSDEVSTTLICDQALRARKRVCYPRMRGLRGMRGMRGVRGPLHRQMDFFSISTPADLLPGYHDILEPRPGSPAVPPQEIDSLCLPGIAFDREGHRLGRGTGYYDRWLTRYTGVRIGLAFACQIVGILPTETQDQGVHYIVTEQGIISGISSEMPGNSRTSKPQNLGT